MIEAFDRITGASVMKIVIGCISNKTKNVVCQSDRSSFVKGQTQIELRSMVFVGTMGSTTIIFRMSLADHRRFNEALDSVNVLG